MNMKILKILAAQIETNVAQIEASIIYEKRLDILYAGVAALAELMAEPSATSEDYRGLARSLRNARTSVKSRRRAAKTQFNMDQISATVADIKARLDSFPGDAAENAPDH